MLIGIDASRYGSKRPTGVEYYTCRVIDGLLERFYRENRKDLRLRLYVAHEFQVRELREHVSERLDIRHIRCGRLWTQVGLSEEMRRDPPDVLFVPSHVLPRKFPKKSIVVVHGLEALHFPGAYSPFARWYQRWTTKYACKYATKLIAVSQAVKNDLMKFFACPEEKIEVVHEGVHPSTVPGIFGEREERKEKVILSVGRIEERKNQLRLVQAFSGIARGFPDYRLLLVGPDGYGAQKVHDFVKRLSSDIREKICFLGHVDHDKVLFLMRRATIFAYPSLAEGFGLPILEAMSIGTPVLTSNTTACAEIAGDAAELVNPLDGESIQFGLQRLLSDKDYSLSLVKKGYERVKKFSWDACIEKLHAVILSVFEN